MQYGLIGEKLSHSFSKDIHQSLADYTYEICEIAQDELSAFLQKREFCAINVTIPYKNKVIPFLDEISDTAQKLQAVNVIVNRNDRLCGHNTDYFGMRDLILRSGVDLTGKKVLILGTGGTSRTSALVCEDLGASEIHLVSREKKNGSITYGEAYSYHTDADVIINATPVGMFPNTYSSPINIEKFDNLKGVFDAVYNPLRTKLMLDAQEKNIYAEGGLYMLVSQAVRAVELFLDTRLDDEIIEDTFKKILRSKENIVLIGMPSSGKTTLGRMLAEQMNREFIDLDDEIEANIGCSIAKYFEAHTEQEFRDLESEITKSISRKNGVVIATGGGCVLRDENVSALRSNGRLYFIDRSLHLLTPTDSRPLARRSGDIEDLYKIRYGIYDAACDVKINGDLTWNKEAQLIKEEFFK